MTEEQAFLAALDLADPADRAAYLDRACGGSTGFRRRVDALLAAHFKPGEFLDEPLARQLDGGSKELDAPKPDGVPDDLHFLLPPTRPGSLGRIGHYEVLQVLGRGAFGIVFRAFDDVLQRAVAVKVLAPAMAVNSPARKRFLREARSSARVRHDNVVQVYAVEEQPLPYLVMEFVAGETLQQRVDRTGPLDVAEVVRLGREIAEGLAAAHATGLVHRDIKPANVLVEAGPRGRARITDFGLARAADDASLTQSGMIAGTPMYMAPEQAQGEVIDHRADLFSFGSVLYLMAAGRPPFRAATTFAVVKRVVEETPRPVRDVIPEVPQWLADAIAKLHAKNPAERFQTAREVADLFAAREANAAPEEPVRAPAPGRSRRWRWVAAAAVLIPVLALAAGGIAKWGRGPQPTAVVPSGGGDPVRTDPPAGQRLPADITNTVGMRFKLIPSGTFRMGSSQDEIDHWFALVPNDARKLYVRSEAPEHRVEITEAFYLGVTEVTVGQFRQFIDANPNQAADDRWRKLPFRQNDEHPAVFVEWQTAVSFCVWLSEKERKQYRLPTEAEWEYCCRAGTAGRRYCFGDDETQLDRYAWYDKNSNFGTKPVGQKAPNDWGLFDMHGNAWEWCQDYHDLRYYESSPAKNPIGPERGTDRVKRGGAWTFGAGDARSAFRSQSSLSVDSGFRVVLVAPSVGK